MKDIILLHGALGAGSDFDALADELRKAGMRPAAFSFPGHGGTPFSPDFGIEGFAGELQSFIDERKFDRPAVFGYSMGGYVALHLAANKAHAIGKIVTLATKFRWTKETVDKEVKMLDPVTMREKVPAFAKSLEMKHGPSWTTLLARTADMMRALSQKDLLGDARLAALRNKVLVGIGDRDQMVTLEETLHVHRTIPGAGMYMLPGTRHPLESADPELLARIIVRFLEKETS